jgi:hypothetical protein
MRQIVSVGLIGLIAVMTVAASSAPLIAQSGGTMTGVARGNHMQSLGGVSVK